MSDLSGSNPASFTLASASLGGVLTLTNVSVTLTLSSGKVSAVSISADSANLTLGGGVTSTIGRVTGSYDITGKTFSLTVNSVNIAFSSFVNISAVSASLTYNASANTTVNLTDGTNTSTKSVSVLTLGINNATVFAGMNGPASNSGAVGVELSGANLALALMGASDGSTYYAVRATGGSLSAVGLPAGFHVSATDLQVQVNGSTNGSNVVNFDSSFAAGTGLAVSTGSSSVNLDYTGQFLQASGTIDLSFNGFVYIHGSMAIQSQANTTVTLTDGTTTTTKPVSELTIGADSVTIFAGMNGPATESGAVGVELDNAGFALALFGGTDGKVYYGLQTTAGALKAVGLPGGFQMSATDLQVQINTSNDGNNVVNFDTFNPGTGLAVQTGTGTSVNLDFTNKFFQASGTIGLNFNGFVYITGSLAIQSQPSVIVTLTDGTNTTTKTVSELTIGADSVTIFAGVNGPATESGAVGVELNTANFALALFSGTDGKVYYGVSANATSLAGVGLPGDITVGAGDLDVQINGSNDGGDVVNFDTSFTPGTGLTVATGPGKSMALDFTGSLIQVAGTLNLGVTDYITISGGFKFTQTAGEIDIAVGHTAFANAADLSFILGSTANPFFSATGFVSMTITANTFTLGVASLTVNTPLKIVSVLEVDQLSVTVSNLSIDLATGNLSGVTDANGPHDPMLTITAASATLFPGNSAITGSVTATTGGDGLGFNGTFDLQTGAFSINLEQFHLAIGSVFTADSTNVLVTYDPANSDPHQQLVQIGSGALDFKFGSSDITGGLTNLTIYADGFHFDSVTIGYTGSIGLGSILSLTSPSVTLTDFGVTFGGSNTTFTESGSLTVSVGTATLNVGSLFSASAASLSITIALDPADLGNVTVTAGTLSVQFGSVITFTGSSIAINTNPADGGAYLSVGVATASLSIGNVLTLTGTATNFSIIKSGSSVQFYEGIPGDSTDKFGVSITATPGQLKLPSWLGFQIQKFEIRWSDFAGHPDQFQLVLSASINSIAGLPAGVSVSGEITDAVIDTSRLEAGEFPIISVGSVGGSVSGSLFGMTVNASFVLGILSFNAEGNLVNVADQTVTHVVTNPDGSIVETSIDANGIITQVTTAANGTVTTTHPSTGPTYDLAVTAATMYVGVAGGAEIPGVGGVQIYIGFSSLGPLTVYLSAEFPLILDPDTGIAIGGFSGGVIFDYSLPTPSQATDLRNISLSPAGITISQWQQQLRDQTITQFTASSGGTNLSAAYSQPFVIEAGVTVYDAYLSQDAFKIVGNLALQIDPGNLGQIKVYVTGTATFGDSVSFNAYLYANIDASGASSTVTFMFLVDVPASTPIESFGGSLTFGFTDANGNPILPAKATATTVSEWIALGTAYDANGAASAGNLAAGTYVWTPGANDVSLTVGGATYLAANAVNGKITITTTAASDVTLNGTANGAVTGTLSSAGNVTGAPYTVSTYSTPTQTIGGFYLSIAGFLEYSALGFASVSITGSVTLTVTATEAKLDLWGELNVTLLGDVAQAEGEFVINYANASSIQFYGALEVQTGAALAKLSTYGLTVDGAILFQINATGADQTVNLPNAPPAGAPTTTPTPLTGANSTSFTILGSVLFDVTITGTGASPYATVSYEVNGDTLFQMQGFFDLRLTDDATNGIGLQMFADINTLTMGPSSSPFLSFSGFGLFVMNSQGLAAEISLNLSAGNAIAGITFSANFDLVINTTSQDVIFNIPSVTVPTSKAGSASVAAVNIYSYDTSGNATLAGAVSSLDIPAGAPLGSPTIQTINATATGTFSPTGAAGPYVVVVGGGSLTVEGLKLNGYFYFQMSDSPGTGFTLVLALDVSGSISGIGQATVIGALQISSTGEVALLSVSGQAGNTTNYGSGISLQFNAELGINTTGTDESKIGGIQLTYGGQNVTLGAHSTQLIASGTLSLSIGGTGFVITGAFAITTANSDSGQADDVSTVTIQASGTLTATVGGNTLLSMNASGVLSASFLTSSGSASAKVYGALVLTVSGGNPLSGNGFAFNGAFLLEVNTTGAQQNPTDVHNNPLTFDGQTVVLTPGPNKGATGSNYVQILAVGSLTFGTATNGFVLLADPTAVTPNDPTLGFYLSISGSGIAVTAGAKMSIVAGGTTLLTVGATGAMLISSSGFAASLTVTATLTDPHGHYAFNGSFTLQVNTTGAAQPIGLITVPAGPNGTTSATGGPYFEMHINGTLALGGTDTGASTGLLMTGNFYLTVGAGGLAVTAAATLNLKVSGANIFTFTANGALLISSDGIAAKITLSVTAGGIGTGFSFGAGVSFLLELNTTGSAVNTINNLPVNLLAGPYFEVVASGHLVIGGVVTISGSFTLTVDTAGVEVVVDATLDLFGNVFSVSGGAGFYHDGFALGINLSLGGSSSPVVTIIPGVLTLSGTFTLEINTTGGSHTFGSITIGSGTTFDVHVSASFNVFGFSLASATFEISEVSGVFFATGQVGFNFFGFISLTVDFYFDSTGGYWFYGDTQVKVGSDGFNIHGELKLEFASNSEIGAKDTYSGMYITHNFELEVDGGVTAFGIKNIISANVDITITGTSVDMSVYAGVSIDVGLFTINIGGWVNIHLGTLNTPTPPPPPPVGVVLTTATTIDGQTFGPGTLLLYLGSYADSSRTGVPSEPDENYALTEDTNGNVFVTAPGVTGQTEEFSGVTEIVAPNAGTSNTVVQLDSSVTAPVVIFAGTGTNQFYTGAGPATIHGSSGNDTVFGGTGSVTFDAGAGASIFVGGGTGSTHNIVNDPGAVTVTESGYYSYSLTGTSATAATLTYDGNTTQLNGSNISLALTGATSGVETFAVSNYSGSATLDAAGNANVTTSITVDSGNLTVSGNTVTESNGVAGMITLQSHGSATYGPLNLYGGSAANTFTVNSWAGGALKLDGKGGSDIYNINFQSSGSFTATVADSGSASDTDSVIINGTASGATINVTSSKVSLGAQTVNYSGVENLTVYTKVNGEIVDVTGTSAATIINTGSYANTINVGTNAASGNTGGTLNNIVTTLTITGTAGADVLNLDDTGDATANTGNLSYDSGTATSTLTGIFGAGGSLKYASVATANVNLGSGSDTFTVQGSGTGTTNLNGGTGNDTFNLQGMSGTMTVKTGVGTNTVNIGSTAPGGSGLLKNIRGTLTISGGGTTTMNADDTGDTAAASGTLTGTTLKGLGMGSSGITYNDVTALNISLGSGGNTFTISNTKASTVTTLNSGRGNDTVNLTTDSGTTTINGQDGNDTINVQSTGGTTNINTGNGVNTVNIGSKAPLTNGIVDNLQGAVVITGNGADTVNVDDTGSSAGKTGLLTNNSLTGLGMGAGGITYSGLAALNISLGSGSDTFNVQGTFAGTVTTVNTGAGTNTVNIASNAPAATGGVLTGIAGKLVVNGQGSDTMNLNDTGGPAAGTLTQTTTTLKGLGMGPNGIVYAGIETLNIRLGAHNNTIYIQGNPAITTENLFTGSGTNIISIGSQAQASIITDPTTGDAVNTGSVLDNVQGIINITGSGTDTLNVDDSGSLTGEGGGLWSNKLQFLDPVTINFTGIAAIYISLSQGNDQFAISDTITSASPAAAVVVDGNGGDDTFVIFDTHAVTIINGGDGDDNFYNFGNSAVLYLNGNAGDDTFYIYASVSASTTNVGPGAADSNGNQVYSYRVNAPVFIDGGTGNDKVFIYATVLNDVITINGTHVTGAGIDVTFTNIEQLVVAGLGGDDTFYIEAIAVPTTIIGDGSIVLPEVADFLTALGLTLPDLTGGAPAPTSFNDTFYVGWQGASYIPGSLAGFVAPLTIYGDNGPNLDGSTTNTPNTTDTIYVDDSADTKNESFILTASTLTGTGFGTGGSLIYDGAVENLNFQLGNGNNTMTVNGTGTATQTSIYGGRGNDTFIVNDANGGALESPLALFGGLNTFAGDTLTVNGAPAGDTFDVTGFTIDGAGATISYEEMEKLTINAGGPTTFNVNGDSIPTYLNGGSAADNFNVNSNVVSLYLTSGAGDNSYAINANSGMLTVTGDAGLDAGNDRFTVNANSGTLILNGGAGNDSFLVNGNSGVLTASGGAGNDSFTVNALSSPATLNGNAGSDSFTVNTPLAAVLTVNGGGDAGDVLTINGTTGSDYVNITGSVVSGIGAAINYSATNLTVNGVAGNDTFQIAGTSAFITRVNGGIYGNDIFNVQATTGALYLTGGAVGNNTFNLGSLAPVFGGTLANITGPVFITGGTNMLRLITLASSGINTINVDDSGDTLGTSGTLTSSTLTGLGMGAGVTYGAVNFINVNLGLGNDTFNVRSTNAATVTKVNTGMGANIINVGSAAPATGGLANGIQGSLTLIGDGNDTLNVDDTGDAVGQSATLTPTTLKGLGMGASGITYSGLAALNVNLGLGNDTFNVPSTNAATVTKVNTGAGVNTVNVGSLAPATGGLANGIQGQLIVVGNGNDTLNVDDTGDAIGQSGTLTATTLTGLGMGASGITYSGLAALNINLGSGNDTFTITGVTNSTVTIVDGGLGTNTAVLNFSGNFAGQNLTLRNFASSTLTVGGDLSGVMNLSGAVTTVTIGGSITSTGVVNAGSIGTMTVGGNLAGLVEVTGLLNTLTVTGAAPGEIIAGDINVITVKAGYGNSLLNVIENGVQRQILATPVAGGTMPGTVHFAFVYDSQTAANPQVAIRITDPNPIARSYNLALVVVNSSTAKFNLSRVDSYLNAKTGISNLSVEGDILTQLTAPELQLFTDLTAGSRAGVMLPADSITGVEVSGNLPIGFINVTGIEGLAFAVLTTAAGVPVNVTTPLSQGNSLWNLLGSQAALNPATDALVVPFNELQSVRLFVRENATNLNLDQIMTLTDEKADNLPVIAYVQVLPTTNASVSALVQSVNFAGSGGSLSSTLSIANLTSTGALGDVTITAPAGATVNNAPGLGNVTAPGIFGSINVTLAGIYGMIQTTSGDLGQVILGANGLISSVTSIYANGAITGQIISRGNLVSSVRTNGAFSGVIAAQGDMGAIQRDANGNAVTNGSSALTRFGGITIGGADSGKIIALGNLFGDVSVSGSMTGRLTVEGRAVAGLAVTRDGVLGNVTVTSFAAGSAIISGGLVSDVTGATTTYLGSPLGFVAAGGAVNLRSTTMAAANLLKSQTGANLAAINAIFANGSLALVFDTGGVLNGLTVIETDLAGIQDNGGVLSGVIP